MDVDEARRPTLLLDASLERYLDTETALRMRKSWKLLDACFRWRLLLAYLAERGVASDSAAAMHLRGMLQRSDALLGMVEFDASVQNIVRLNIPIVEAMLPPDEGEAASKATKALKAPK